MQTFYQLNISVLSGYKDKHPQLWLNDAGYSGTTGFEGSQMTFFSLITSCCASTEVTTSETEGLYTATAATHQPESLHTVFPDTFLRCTRMLPLLVS